MKRGLWHAGLLLINHSTALVEPDDVKALHSEPAQHHDSLFVSVDSGCVIPMCCRWSWGGSWQCEQQQEAGWGLAGGPVPCRQWLSCEFLCQRRGWGSQWSCLRKASRTTLWLSGCLKLKYALFQTWEICIEESTTYQLLPSPWDLPGSWGLRDGQKWWPHALPSHLKSTQ